MYSLLNIFLIRIVFFPLSLKSKTLFHKCVSQSHLFRSGRLNFVKKSLNRSSLYCVQPYSSHCLTSNFCRAGLCLLILYTNKMFHCSGFCNCLLHVKQYISPCSISPHNFLCMLSVFSSLRFAVYFTHTRAFYATV
jgi:hypothetical protein